MAKKRRDHQPRSVYATAVTYGSGDPDNAAKTFAAVEFMDSDGRWHRVLLTTATFDQLFRTMQRTLASKAWSSIESGEE